METEAERPLGLVWDLNHHPSPSPIHDRSQNHNHQNQTSGGDRWMCQVEGCEEDGTGRSRGGADLKDYHRRHRVCPAHTRAPSVTLRGGCGALFRFCQQCSKFHALHEFDHDKRSCRRRLNRHNGRRRIRNCRRNASASSSSAAPISLNGFDPDLSRAIVLALLRIISAFELARPDPVRDQELILRFLASLSSSSLSAADISDLLQRSAPPTNDPGSSSMPPSDLNVLARPSTTNATDCPIRDFDLNEPIFEIENENEPEPEHEHEHEMGCSENSSPNLSQPSRNDSDSLLLPSSSGDTQGRTGRVVFKLFGKDLADSPPNLHSEILTWLSHCPIEMESYIKPGCIVLTVYLCLTVLAWDELAHNLASWIERLILIPDHDFWRSGWVYATLQDQAIFIYNGTLVLEAPLLLRDPNQFRLLNISPIAVSSSSNVTFYLKGYDLSQSSARLFVAYDGEYLVQGLVQDFVEKPGDAVPGRPKAECASFSCTVPASDGRGFIEIEECDQSSFFFPFIISDEATCIEIRELESEIDLISNQQNDAMEFLQEMGWLLRRAHRQSDAVTYPAAFSVVRYRLLVSFAMDRGWCSVLKKLLDILVNGDVHLDGCSVEEFVLQEGLLFEAVRKKSKPLVAFLLRYKVRRTDSKERYLFTPDMVGPSTNNMLFITPLHLAAMTNGAESVLDALTDDPGKIGIKAWLTSRGGNRGNRTPAELAWERAHISYIQLVQNKIDLISKKAEVDSGTTDMSGWSKGHLDIEKGYLHCKRCMQLKPAAHGPAMNGCLVNRPAVLTLVCIAAVCVCVSIILKTLPFVRYTRGPFLWDSLGHGDM